jgi:thiosulfate dehydrogenase [quinone] large subunit
MSESATNNSPKKGLSDATIAYGVLRLTLGINIALHGISRVISGQAAFLAYLNHYFEKTPLMPKEILPFFALFITWAETILGTLVFFGAFTRYALVGGSLVLAMLAFGTNLAQDWGIAGLQLTYALVYYFLLKHREELNGLSVDAMMGK